MSEAHEKPQDVVIADFVLTDFDEVYGLWERCGLWLRPSDGRDALELKLTRDPDLFLVARQDRRLVGTAMGGWDGRRAYVYHLAVDPQMQRRGIGGTLMDVLEERFRARGALKAKLQIQLGNDASLAFFRGRGYEIERECLQAGKELVAGGAPRDWRPQVGEEWGS